MPPQEGLRVLQAVLASASLPQNAAAWPAAFLASPINWPNLLSAPARAGASLYADFQVRASPAEKLPFGLWPVH